MTVSTSNNCTGEKGDRSQDSDLTPMVVLKIMCRKLRNEHPLLSESGAKTSNESNIVKVKLAMYRLLWELEVWALN